MYIKDQQAKGCDLVSLSERIPAFCFIFVARLIPLTDYCKEMELQTFSSKFVRVIF